MQFIVMQEPKAKERVGLVCRVIVVEAKTKASIHLLIFMGVMTISNLKQI